MTMETHEWEDFKATLQDRRAELVRVIVDSEQVVQDQLRAEAEDGSKIDFNHPADAVTGDADYEKELNLVRRQRAELILVDQALGRIKSGTYGSCQDCGSEVGVARLRAVPYTKFCLECQQRDDGRADPFHPPAPRPSGREAGPHSASVKPPLTAHALPRLT